MVRSQGRGQRGVWRIPLGRTAPDGCLPSVLCVTAFPDTSVTAQVIQEAGMYPEMSLTPKQGGQAESLKGKDLAGATGSPEKPVNSDTGPKQGPRDWHPSSQRVGVLA